MKNFFTTLRNIWEIKELRDKLLYTLGMLAIFRLGTFIVLPGVNPLSEAFKSTDSKADLLGLINNFTGGAFDNASIFALGIMPYITASIIVQLLGFAVPYFQRLQQREGESGRKKLNQIMRMLTVAITLVQGGAYVAFLSTKNAIGASISPSTFWLTSITVLAAGTLFAMWLGERINDKGIGNGTSLIIMTGIMSRLPKAISAELGLKLSAGNGGILSFVIELVVFVLIIVFTILLVQGVRRIPVQFAKRMVGRDTVSMPTAGNRDFIPLKLNTAGVMPIIFAQALMFIPAALGKAFGAENTFSSQIGDPSSAIYNVLYFVLVVIFTYVYTALVVNPRQYSEYLQRQNAFIPGVKPGESTEDYIDNVTSRITLPGGILIALVAILPYFAGKVFGINNSFASFFGGTSLLIFVGVILDTLQQIEVHLKMKQYDGLVSSGSIQGRSQGGLQQIGGFN
jgi:preprotein translocase subunit SecY